MAAGRYGSCSGTWPAEKYTGWKRNELEGLRDFGLAFFGKGAANCSRSIDLFRFVPPPLPNPVVMFHGMTTICGGWLVPTELGDVPDRHIDKQHLIALITRFLSIMSIELFGSARLNLFWLCLPASWRLLALLAPFWLVGM